MDSLRFRYVFQSPLKHSGSRRVSDVGVISSSKLEAMRSTSGQASVSWQENLRSPTGSAIDSLKGLQTMRSLTSVESRVEKGWVEGVGSN